MAEYIEREALLLRIDLRGTNKFGMLDEDIRQFIREQPAAEVVEVVRCKDCISRGTESCAMYYECDCCEQQHTWETDNDFCSYGERKQNGI